MLVDVSESMRKPFALDDRSKNTSVERVHAIITTVLHIVKSEVNYHNRSDGIFVGAFGLDSRVDTCDLIALLDIFAGPKELRKLSAHGALVKLARDNGAAHAEKWIRKHLTDIEAKNLFRIICFDKSLIHQFVQKLPKAISMSRIAVSAVGIIPVFGNIAQAVAVHRSEAYEFAQKLIRDMTTIIKEKLRAIECPSPVLLQEVSDLLDDLNVKDDISDDSRSLHGQMKEIIDPIIPYIFGRTPMCKAINNALRVFESSGEAKSKVLFILSDGDSTDGNAVALVEDLDATNVIRVTCFLTDEHIPNQKCLIDKAPSHWKDGRGVLFGISSTVRNCDPPVSFLVDAGWTLPTSGESRLFVQANSLDVVDELCKIVVAELTNPCDALVDLLEKVPLSLYINDANANFKPENQVGNTCYAHAVATVCHLAMHRIVGRDGGIPEFKKIKDTAIDNEQKDGAYIFDVMKKVCPQYRLYYHLADEIRARQALNCRRPLVAVFSLTQDQWAKFKLFYKKTPKGILEKGDIGGNLLLYMHSCSSVN